MVFLSELNSFLWGKWMIGLLILSGIYLTVKMDFLQFRKFGYAMKNTVFSLFSKKQHCKDSAGVSPFQAVSTAMAATIGTGSIAGLATALNMGGPGAIFWMWVSAFLGMVIKYCEIVLSIKYREKNESGQWVGGPMYYIQNGLRRKTLAAAFCVFGMLACLGIGNATQANSIADALQNMAKIDVHTTGIWLSAITAAVILGGMRRIASVNEKLVPFMAIFYVLCAIIAIFVNRENIPSAFSLIFKEAFNFESAAGGVGGYGIVSAMHYGFSRGIFSNEAGLGSAPIAHAASSAKEPVRQGLWGIFEVFFTTIVICTLSALVLLTSGLWSTGEYRGAVMSIAAFESAIPNIGGLCVTMATVLFAISSILGWAYYGEVCTMFLTDNSKTALLLYRCLYVGVSFIGAVASLEIIWQLSETMNALMAIPNLIGVIGLSSVVKKLTKEYFKK